MITIDRSASALAAQKALASHKAALDRTIAQLSSGRRIDQAGDDAAGLGVSTRLGAQARSFAMAERNANDGISAIQAADGGVASQADGLQRLRELATRAASGGLSAADRANLDEERAALTQELDRVAASTTYNGAPLLGGGGHTSLTLQVGIDADAASAIKVTFGDTTTRSLGLAGLRLDTAAGARQALSAIDSALASLSSTRAGLGATQRRVESALDTGGSMGLELTTAGARLVDADVASATAALAGRRILAQAGVAVLAQANRLPGAALPLLR